MCGFRSVRARTQRTSISTEIPPSSTNPSSNTTATANGANNANNMSPVKKRGSKGGLEATVGAGTNGGGAGGAGREQQGKEIKQSSTVTASHNSNGSKNNNSSNSIAAHGNKTPQKRELETETATNGSSCVNGDNMVTPTKKAKTNGLVNAQSVDVVRQPKLEKEREREKVRSAPRPMAKAPPASMDPLKMMGMTNGKKIRSRSNSDKKKDRRNGPNGSTFEKRMEKIFGEEPKNGLKKETSEQKIILPPRKSGSWTSVVSDKSEESEDLGFVHPKMRAKLASQKSVDADVKEEKSSVPENSNSSGRDTIVKLQADVIGKGSTESLSSKATPSGNSKVENALEAHPHSNKQIKKEPKPDIKIKTESKTPTVVVEKSGSTGGDSVLDSVASVGSSRTDGGHSPRRRRLFHKKSPVSVRRKQEAAANSSRKVRELKEGDPALIALKLEDQGGVASGPINKESGYAKNAFAVQKAKFMKLQQEFMTNNWRPMRGQYANYLCIEEDENGGGTIVHIYMDDFEDMEDDEKDKFVRECMREVFAETNGVPHHTMGIVHGGMNGMPNYLQFLAENHPKTTVKVEKMGQSAKAKTVPISEYYDEVQATFKANTHEAGPMRNISIVGTVQEEHGGYFKDMIESLEENAFLKATLPWGTFSSVHGMHPRDSDDGPILWCRPGEQVLNLADTGIVLNNQKPLNVYSSRRADKPREKLIEDKTGAHADHAGLPPHRKAVPAVAFLQAVDEHESRIIKDVISFHAGDYDRVAELCGLDYNEEPMDQRIDSSLWFDYSKLNQLRRLGVRYSWLKLRANDIYFIPKGCVHQFRTVSGSISCAWHLKYAGV
eukprot:Nk52_evm17s485 gene=Nk52_evmTU17s485